MGVDTEIIEGQILVGFSTRVHLECMFEVEFVVNKTWVRPLKGSLYIVQRRIVSGRTHVSLRLPSIEDESELADLTLLMTRDCSQPTREFLSMYDKMPLV